MRLGIYKHYKGNLYNVIGILNSLQGKSLEQFEIFDTATHSENLIKIPIYKKEDLMGHTYSNDMLVLYRAMYGDALALWVRPLHMFEEFVTVNGLKVKRFECQSCID